MKNKSSQSPLVIAISGGSGSGKTTLASMLKEHYSGSANLMSLDSYYKDLSGLTVEDRVKMNFDHPSCIDFLLFKENVALLKKNKAINDPIYSFDTHCRLKETNRVEAAPLLILEGLYSFYDKNVSKVADLKIYVDAGDDIRLIRRIRRDVRERGRDIESILSQYESTVRVMHQEYVEKQKNNADLIIINDGKEELQSILTAIIYSIDKMLLCPV